MYKKLVELIFFGNYFYAACVVALAVEANLQMGLPLNPLLFYLLMGAATVVYYTKAYLSEATINTTNRRTNWYQQHRGYTKIAQPLLSVFVIAGTVYYAVTLYKGLFQLSFINWLGLCTIPVSAVLYYGLSWKNMFNINLRSNGWIKPFVIGFVWAGAVTIYPVVFKAIQLQLPYVVSFLSIWLFIKNWMYITVLCIMFDIKDYAADHNMQLKTFVVRVGLRKTIFSIMMPLAFAGWVSFLIFSGLNHFPFLKVAINSIPFVLLLMVAYSMHERRNIFYYLMIIDGLMLAKAICGIAGVLLAG